MAITTKEEKIFRVLQLGMRFILLFLLHVTFAKNDLVVTLTTAGGSSTRNDGRISHHSSDDGSRNDAALETDVVRSIRPTLRGEGSRLLYHNYQQQQEEEEEVAAAPPPAEKEGPRDHVLEGTRRLLQQSSDNNSTNTTTSSSENSTTVSNSSVSIAPATPTETLSSLGYNTTTNLPKQSSSENTTSTSTSKNSTATTTAAADSSENTTTTTTTITITAPSSSPTTLLAEQPTNSSNSTATAAPPEASSSNETTLETTNVDFTTSTANTTTTTTTTVIPSGDCNTVNGSATAEPFSTLIAISFPGNRTLATDENVNLFATTFANTYNSRTTTTSTGGDDEDGNDDSIIICDPLFRSIKSIQATANVSLPGRSNWDELGKNLPIIPVRRGRRRRRRTSEEQEESSTTTTSSSSSANGVLWESLVEAHLLDIEGGDFQPEEHHRQLQLQQPGGLPLVGAAETTATAGNWTVANYNVIFILLDIVGECRGCQGGTGRLNLFDDISTTQVRDRQLRGGGGGGRGRHLQQTTEDTCTCPIDSKVADPNTFQASLNTKMEELKEDDILDFGISFQQENDENNGGNSGFIEFVDVPVVERPCATEELPFTAVHFVKGVIFDPLYIFNVGGTETIQQVEQTFRESYNEIAQQLCDSLFRTIDTVEFISYFSEEGNNNGEGTVTIEFVVDATCRGTGCNDPGCLFEGADGSCQDGAPQQRERQRRRAEEMAETIVAAGRGQRRTTSDKIPNFLFRETSLLLGTSNRSGMTSNHYPPQDRRHLQAVEGERCVCREDRAPRPPNHDEVRDLFQVGLDKITESFILCVVDDNGQFPNTCSCQSDANCISGHCDERSGTCQVPPPAPSVGLCARCKDGSDCPSSGICIGSVCAEADGFLSHTCQCLDHESCHSGRCKDLGLVCETVCPEGEGGGSSFCVEECFGICTAKIQDTCMEPCVTSRDCESGNCGSIVCLPGNGTTTTKLSNGCYSALGSECESGRSENKTCTAPLPLDVMSAAPSTQPSIPPSAGPTSPPSYQPSSSPSSKPSTKPSSKPSDQPSVSPSEAPTTSGPTFSPSIAPSGGPTASPSSSPSGGPSFSPSLPPTGGPSASPSSLPTGGPSASPSHQPSGGPTGGPTTSPSHQPSGGPTAGPTTSPSTPPTGGPSASPSFPPTGGPSVSPSTPPTEGPSVSPSSPPTGGPSASPTSGPSLSPSIAPSGWPTASPTASPTPGPTLSPTAPPTPGPTPSPTSSPTPGPTPSPTESPTPGPTSSPTAAPTPGPTPSPTTSPTPGPTPSPTPGPTPSPTPGPTPSPTPGPTPGPTPSPTASPTPGPTPSPTPGPTPSPTPGPTPGPTPSPTPGPTASPTASPTPGPTPSPTASPTPVPTQSPTASPTAGPTPGPTPSPTESPTSGPTPSPTPGPTPGPTASPTPGPTPSPTPGPTPSPTASPTPGPTPSPTPGPTPSPTASPTPGPTPSPTPGPTPSPTSSPTPGPTPSPTSSPTPSPTPGPTPSPTPSPTPGPTPTPGPNAPCGSAAGNAVCPLNEEPWCTSLGVCSGDPSDEADCHPDFSVSGTCVRTRCGAAFGGAVCPFAGAIYYCTPENYCDATIKTGCQVDYSFEGTCGPQPLRCGPSYGGARCGQGTPWCSIHAWCGIQSDHITLCVSDYCWYGVTCNTGYSF